MDSKSSSSSDKTSVEMLLVIGSKAFSKPLLNYVSDDANEVLCGWRLAKPRPEYRVIARKKRKRPGIENRAAGSTTMLPSLPRKDKAMSGKLTENYDYVYEGVCSEITVPKRPVINDAVVQNTILLNPVVVDRSDSMSEKARSHIQQLAQRQLRRDVAYEQMIINEKLKTIDLNPTCEFQIKGIFGTSDSTSPSVQADNKNSKSTRNSLHKKHRNPNMFRNPMFRNPNIPRNPLPRPLDLTLLKEPTPLFKNEYKPVLKSSFSRLLESSSVVFSYKK